MLPMNAEAYGEFLVLQSELDNVHLSEGLGDDWSYIWNVDKYSAQRFKKNELFMLTASKAACLDLEDKACDENQSVCLAPLFRQN